MKELEKTKRISVAGVLFILIILIGVLSYERPKHIFEKNSKTTLEKLVSKDYILSLKDLNNMDAGTYALIDIRSNFEFVNGHFENASNIATNQLLDDSSIDFLKTLKDANKTAILYGKNADEANSAWMLLYQLGYENTKILSALASVENNKFLAKNYTIENPEVNYAEVMLAAKTKRESSKTNLQSQEIKKAAPKKVITVQKKKKKKKMPEGGC
jgi:rhodanese-related sulfurtransferase